MTQAGLDRTTPDALDGDDNAPGEPDALEPERREWLLDPAHHQQRIDKMLVVLAPRILAQPPAGRDRPGARHARWRGRRQRVAHACVLGQRLQVDLVADRGSRWPSRPQPMALDIVHRRRTSAGARQAGGIGGASGGRQLVGHLAQRLAGASRAGRAACRVPASCTGSTRTPSGLMVVAKTLPAMTALVRAIAAREVQRVYLRAGRTACRPWPTLTIDAPIGRDPQQRMRMAVVAGGKPARTDVTCLLPRHVGPAALQCTLAHRAHAPDPRAPVVARAPAGR